MARRYGIPPSSLGALVALCGLIWAGAWHSRRNKIVLEVHFYFLEPLWHFFVGTDSSSFDSFGNLTNVLNLKLNLKLKINARGKKGWNLTKTMRLIIFSQPSAFIRGHLHAQLEHGWWHRAITIPPHLDTQIKDLRPNATGVGLDSDRSLNCRIR